MNINTLTVKAQEALQSALTLARERGQQAVEPVSYTHLTLPTNSLV